MKANANEASRKKASKMLHAVLVRLNVFHEVERECNAIGISFDILTSASRTASVVRIRSWVMLILRDRAGLSTPEIGELLARDHSTVLVQLAKARKDLSLPSVPEIRTAADERTAVVRYLTDEADRLHREQHPAAQEIERIAGVIRRSDHRNPMLDRSSIVPVLHIDLGAKGPGPHCKLCGRVCSPGRDRCDICL